MNIGWNDGKDQGGTKMEGCVTNSRFLTGLSARFGMTKNEAA
jgi:hypothetical protein